MGAGAAVPLIGSEALRFARRSARINQTRSMHTSTRQVKFGYVGDTMLVTSLTFVTQIVATNFDPPIAW